MNDRLKNWKEPEIAHNVPTKWNWVVAYPDGFKNGKNTDIGAFTYIQAQAGVELGDSVQIGSHCSIYSVSTIDQKQGKVTVEKGACIGSHSTVMPGVTIGKGAIVGAHSFVTENIPSGSIAYGVPAVVHKRK